MTPGPPPTPNLFGPQAPNDAATPPPNLFGTDSLLLDFGFLFSQLGMAFLFHATLPAR